MLLQKAKGLVTYIYRVSIVTCFFALTSYSVKAQTEVQLSSIIQRQLPLYQKVNPSSVLFVHFDKTVYTNNDNIWFTAYLLKCNNIGLHHTLSVSLVNDVDRSIVAEDKFVMANGLAFGIMHLSDSIPPGNYTFMIYTNRLLNHKPEVFFNQPVTIKTTSQANFSAILSLTDTSHHLDGKARNVILNVNGNDYLPLANAEVDYSISGADTILTRGKAQTNRAGQYIVPVAAGKNMIKVQVKNKKSSQYIYLPLPLDDQDLKIKFYPEGGHLVNNITTRIGWEVKKAGLPLPVQAVLYENDTAIDTVATSSYGLGSFSLNAKSGKQYAVKLSGHTNSADQKYVLPPAVATGVTLTMYKAVVNDTLNLALTSIFSGKLYLNVHNYQQQFFLVPLKVHQYIPQKVKIALDSLPKGLAGVTITDSTGKPYAERLFFAHHNKREQLQITTDKNIYNTRQKVTLKLRLNNINRSAIGLASVACVQDNRIELKKANDIESYLYLKTMIQDLSLKDDYLGRSGGDIAYIEQLLLVRGWRKYSWMDLLVVSKESTVADSSSAKYTGKIKVWGKEPKKPVYFIINRDSSSSLVLTDAAGNFAIGPQQLISNYDKKVRFLSGTKDGYEINVTDPYLNINQNLASQHKPLNFEQPLTSYSNDNFAIKGLEKAIQLRAVTVTAGKDYSIFAARANACGDYVCAFNILNCPNHPGDLNNKAPVVGHNYKYNGSTIRYTGCSGNAEGKSMTSMKGIFKAKEYYGSDYSVANPAEPEYISTIFWKHLIEVSADKDTTLSFYTSDITGKFRIIVQGITINDVVYGSSSIQVKKE